MKYTVYKLPAYGDREAEKELNNFLSNHAVIDVEKEFIDNGSAGFWSLLIMYETNMKDKIFQNRIDYKEKLNPHDFAVFSKLRELRKKISEEAAVPVYSVFTNEQLAEMVEKKTTTKHAIMSIKGIGEHKFDNYGKPVLELLKSCFDEAKKPSV